MNKLSLSIISLLLIIIGLGAYKFVIQGNVVASADNAVDNRMAILLDAGERGLILEEMRGFLLSTQQIIKAVSDDDMEQAAIAAKKVGRIAQAEVPGTLIAKLPIAFKKLGFDTHTKFDELAMDASDMEDKEQTLKLLSKLMNNCIACHSAYRLEIEKKQVSTN
jgi:hypothetical protein